MKNILELHFVIGWTVPLKWISRFEIDSLRAIHEIILHTSLSFALFLPVS